MALLHTIGALALSMCIVPAVVAVPWAHDWNESGNKLRTQAPVQTQEPRVFASAGGNILLENGAGRVAAYRADGQYLWSAVAAGSASHGTLPAANVAIVDAIIDDDASAWLLESDDKLETASVLSRIGADGRIQWSRYVPGAALARVTGGAVVVGSRTDLLPPVLTRWDENGHLIWQSVLPQSPTDMLAIAVANDGEIHVLGVEGRVFLTRFGANGVALQTTELPTAWPSRIALRVTSSRVYVALGEGIRVLDRVTGAQRWSTVCGVFDIVPQGAAGEGDLICSQDGALVRTVVRQGASDGQMQWSAPSWQPRRLRAMPGGIVAGSRDSVSYLDDTTGAERWRTTGLGSGADDVVGVSYAANGYVNAALSKCAMPSGPCLASIRRFALASGTMSELAAVEDSAAVTVGESVREGGDVFSVLATTGGDAAALRLRRDAASDGTSQWQASYALDPGHYLHGARIVVGSDYVAAIALSTGEGTSNVHVVAFDRATGVQRWVKRFHDYGIRIDETPALVVDSQGQLVLAFPYWNSQLSRSASQLTRLSRVDGAILWSNTLGYGLASLPNLRRFGNDIAVGFNNSVMRIAIADGHTVWNRDFRNAEYAPFLVLPNNDLVFPAYDFNGRVVCLDHATGDTRWVGADLNNGSYNRIDRLAPGANGSLVAMGGRSLQVGGNSVNRPFVARLDTSTGAEISRHAPVIGVGVGGEFLRSNFSSDGRWWVAESRDIAGMAGVATRWLAELDMGGQATGYQALGLPGHGDLVRGDWALPLGAPEAGSMIVSGPSYGANLGPGLSTSLVDTTVTANGNLAVVLDATAPFEAGGSVPYGATVNYQGDVPVRATLMLFLPWSDPGVSPACVAPSGDCTLETRGGWLVARMRLSPGDAARVTGTLVAGRAPGAYGGNYGNDGPVFAAIAQGETGLRETVIDDNHTAVDASMSLFADGFD